MRDVRPWPNSGLRSYGTPPRLLGGLYIVKWLCSPLQGTSRCLRWSDCETALVVVVVVVGFEEAVPVGCRAAPIPYEFCYWLAVFDFAEESFDMFDWLYFVARTT